MRPDQLRRLAELSAKLADKVLDEADPDTWPGAGSMLADMSKQERGDAYWCKKNAAATLALLVRVEGLQEAKAGAKLPGDPDETDVESEIAKAEKKATQLLEQTLAKHGRGEATR